MGSRASSLSTVALSSAPAVFWFSLSLKKVSCHLDVPWPDEGRVVSVRRRRRRPLDLAGAGLGTKSHSAAGSRTLAKLGMSDSSS